MTIDVYNIIRQLTDQEDPISGQMKRECFNELLPINSYYKGWSFQENETQFNFLPHEDYPKDRYEVVINDINDDVERVEKLESLNEDIDEYNDWVNEKNQLHSDELFEKAKPDGKVHDVKDLNLESKCYFILGKHKPWLCQFIIEHPQFRKIDNYVEFGWIDDEVIYKLMQEMEIEEFVNRFNATLFGYIKDAVHWLEKNKAFDKEALWYEPNREFANWFSSKNLMPNHSDVDWDFANPKGFKTVQSFGAQGDDPIRVKSPSDHTSMDDAMEFLNKMRGGGFSKDTAYEGLHEMMDGRAQPQSQLDEELKEIFTVRDIESRTHMQVEMEMREIFEEHKGKGYFIGDDGFEQLKVCYEWGCKFWTLNGSRLTVKQMQKGATRYPK